jgi:hypothetical protein
MVSPRRFADILASRDPRLAACLGRIRDQILEDWTPLLGAVLAHDVGRVIPRNADVASPAHPGGFRCPHQEWGRHCAGKRLIQEHWATEPSDQKKLLHCGSIEEYTHHSALQSQV